MVLNIFTDGGARGNPGPAAAGWVVKDGQGRILEKGKRYLGKTTNNVAEYQGVYDAFLWLMKQKGPEKRWEQINFFLDSKLIASQLAGLFKIKAAHLVPWAARIKEMEKKLGLPVSYHYVPRSQNKEADALVNEALDEANVL